jgi:hypothetical protein
MAELSPRALGWFIEAVLPVVMERTGLPREEAAVAAESLVPPFEQDEEGNIVLRGADGTIVGAVSKDDVNPFDVIDDIEESGASVEIEDGEDADEVEEA